MLITSSSKFTNKNVTSLPRRARAPLPAAINLSPATVLHFLGDPCDTEQDFDGWHITAYRIEPVLVIAKYEQ